MAAPPPLPPGGAAPAKKTNLLLWVLIGVGVVFVLFIVGLMAASLFVAHKVKQASVDGNGIVFNSRDGTVQIGGRAKIPAWVPDYPGSNPRGTFTASGKDGGGGIFAFTTNDSPDKVYQYYQDQFQSSGLKVNAIPQTHMLVAKDESNRHNITVMIGDKVSPTSVTVTYGTNK
ncbi:MAG TPA: hypothetical protein VMH80_26145 [Bryobacteraceae bacterium]|nr:hypothetical protein [Bryobacteraceae bacterium]